MVGLGIGPRTEHIKSNYPEGDLVDSVAGEDVETFADDFIEIIAKIVKKG
jgi:hypothetical protein